MATEQHCHKTGKIIYANHAEAVAVAVARLIGKRHGGDGRGRAEPFRCRGCRGWHIGRKVIRSREFGKWVWMAGKT